MICFLFWGVTKTERCTDCSVYKGRVTYKKRLRKEQCRGYTLLRVIRSMRQDFILICSSKHHHLPGTLPFSSCIFTENGWLNYREEQRFNSCSFALSLLFLDRQQTVFTAESEHHSTKLCQDFLRPSSCESWSGTIIRQTNNLFIALDLHVFTMGAQDKMVIFWEHTNPPPKKQPFCKLYWHHIRFSYHLILWFISQCWNTKA